MTQDDIIKLARKAQGTPYVNRHYPGLTSFGFSETTLAVFAALVAAAEREACETAVEDIARKYQQAHHPSAENVADECASRIRARSQT